MLQNRRNAALAGPAFRQNPQSTENAHVSTFKMQKDKNNALEYLLYTLAGSVFAAISFSFVLWLRY